MVSWHFAACDPAPGIRTFTDGNALSDHEAGFERGAARILGLSRRHTCADEGFGYFARTHSLVHINSK